MIETLKPDLPSAAARVADALSPIARDTQAMLSLVGSGPADEVVHRDPVFGPRLQTMASEAVRQGVEGLAADIVASTIAPWDFDPSAVSAPVELWYGEQDELVPPEHGAWWAGVLSNCNLHVVHDAGHLLPVARWKSVLASTA